MEAFEKTAGRVAEELGTDAQKGLSDADVARMREKYGVNEFTRAKPPGLGARFVAALREPMLIMLLVAGAIAVAVNVVESVTGGAPEWIECIGIFAAIFISVVITVVMEGRSAKAFEELNKIKEDVLVKVIRGGKAVLVPGRDVVVGDIIRVETGDKVPADARLVSCVDLQTDESSLTGESMPVKKDADAVLAPKTPVAERANMLYSGCFVTSGNATAIVTAVGDNTEFGEIAKALQKSESVQTPLQTKLARLGKTIAVLGSVAAAVVFVIQLVQMSSAGPLNLSAVLEAFLTSIVLIVASVPEGLPTIVAVSLALNVIKMARENALVKKLSACETIGSVNIICSDKTGTLTQNRMTVTAFYVGQDIQPDELQSEAIRRNICINSTAEADETRAVGNPTECALLRALPGVDYVALRAGIQDAFAFSSEQKCMTTLTKDGVAYTKGSPEKVLAFCTHTSLSGGVRPLDDAARAEIEQAAARFQENAGRVIAFAHKETGGGERAEIESGMVYDGFAVIADPLRGDVADAVRECRRAGVGVKMLTGDNIVTARAIAAQLDMLENDALVVTAMEIDEMDDEALRRALPRIAVIARSTPTVKLRVVRMLIDMGNVVAVTGDGINDAPAIKQADVGIAMGITGTEVTKEASDIVSLDDSFTTIVKAVRWGRGIYENFKRFIQFQLTVNVSSVLTVLLCVVLGLGAPFTALQLLWVNLIMDGPPALTLGLMPIGEDLMKRPPIARGQGIVDKSMGVSIAVNGIYITAVLLLQQTFNFLGGAAEEMGSIIFTLFVTFQLFNAFNAQQLGGRSLFAHKGAGWMMPVVFGATFALQVVITQFGGAVFSTTPLSLVMWFKIVVTAMTIILVAEITKIFIRLRNR